jgi:hypothetical protein
MAIKGGRGTLQQILDLIFFSVVFSDYTKPCEAYYSHILYKQK